MKNANENKTVKIEKMNKKQLLSYIESNSQKTTLTLKNSKDELLTTALFIQSKESETMTKEQEQLKHDTRTIDKLNMNESSLKKLTKAQLLARIKTIAREYLRINNTTDLKCTKAQLLEHVQYLQFEAIEAITFNTKKESETMTKTDKKKSATKKKATANKSAKKQTVYQFPDESTQAFLIDTLLKKNNKISVAEIHKKTKLSKARIYKRIAHIKDRLNCPYFLEK